MSEFVLRQSQDIASFSVTEMALALYINVYLHKTKQNQNT